MRRIVSVGIAAVTLLSVGGVAGAAPPTKKAPVKLSGDVTNKGTGSVTNGAADIEVNDFFFKKTFIKATKGKTVSVTVTNEGSNQHTFTIDAQDVDETLDPGKSVTIDVEIPADGKPVAGYCRFHKGSGMKFAFFSKSGSKAKPSSTDDDSTTPGGYGY